ncbi:MAG: hypothetical protein AUH35_01300 [Nitrospirae bacterium 13_1_40CM_62_7]|nr:MAG: hypothetical protein AUH35_01300 [Nitrospirae bacterium 13_1_40CM_62_7]
MGRCERPFHLEEMSNKERRSEMRTVTVTVFIAVLVMALVGPSVVAAEPQEASAPEMQAQLEALSAKVAALNATLGAAVSQIAALATAMVTLQAQMATGHGAVTSQAVLAVLPPHNGTLPPHSTLPEIARSLGLPAEQVTVQEKKAVQETIEPMAQYRFLGYLLQNGKSCAFLGKGSELFIVRTGETVDGHLQVTAIDAASVKLLDPSTSQETTLLLAKVTEGQP